MGPSVAPFPMAVRVPVESGARTRPSQDVRCRASLVRGRPPRAGIATADYAWHDVVTGAPPRRPRRGEGAYVVFEGIDIGPDLRITSSTVVSVDPGTSEVDTRDDIITVDARLTVQRRAFMELMHRERLVMDAWASRARSRLAQRHSRYRARLERARLRPLARMASGVLRLEARVSLAIIRWVRDGVRAIIEVPDSLAQRAAHAKGHLEGRGQRRGIWRGIRDPATLSNEQKGVVLTLTLAALVVAVFLLNTVLLFAWPNVAVTYRALLSDALAGLLGMVALPLPIEIFVVNSVLARGIAWGAAGLLVGKALGAWMLYLFGDALNDALRSMTKGRPRVDGAVQWTRSAANRFGFVLLLLVNAMPFVPDTLVYVFAVSGMRFRSYFWGIMLGTALKFAGIIVGIHLIGPERVRDFLGG